MLTPSLILVIHRRGSLTGVCHGFFIHRQVVDNFLCPNVVSMTLTRHNEGMSNTATFRKSLTGKFTYIDYANGEWAMVGKTSIWSQPDHSTAIAEWAYYPASQTLTVMYKNGDTRYRYEGVPMSVIFSMMTADSLGAFIAREVKPHYSVVGA